MNVYDRVVPNNATDTLWMLALGVLLIFGMDFMTRVLRGHFVDLASARIDVKLFSADHGACARYAPGVQAGVGRFLFLEFAFFSNPCAISSLRPR